MGLPSLPKKPPLRFRRCPVSHRSNNKYIAFFRSHLIAITWIFAVFLAIVLYIRSPQFLSYRGIAEVVEYHPASSETAKVVEIKVLPGQRVMKGEVIAILESPTLAYEIEVARANLALAEAEMESRKRMLERNMVVQARGFQQEVNRAEKTLIEARAQLESDLAELKAVRERIQWWKPMVDSKAASAQTLTALQSEEIILSRRVYASQQGLKVAEKNLKDAQDRLREFKNRWDMEGSEISEDIQIIPFKRAVELARAKLEQLEKRKENLRILAPDNGIVQRVRVQPGDVVTQGSPVVEIRAEKIRRVLAFVSDTQASLIGPGTKAIVRPRDGSGMRLTGRVYAVGAGVRAFPEQTLLNPNWREFGQEVVIYLDQDGLLAPGQVVDVSFEHDDDKDGVLSKANAHESPENKPQKVTVPDRLKEASRLEPSGLVFIEEWERFLVVSDDTGLGGKEEHKPWMFLMDNNGVFDPNPIIVEGIEELNDIESITRSPNKTIWALASQTPSKKGKRPESRTLLFSMKIDQQRLVATGRASLLKGLIDMRDEAYLDSLGLTKKVERIVDLFDRVINIEGLAWYKDGLLIGLKEPITPDGKAIIWFLRNPEKFVKHGVLDKGDLNIFGFFPLPLDEKGRMGGISDLFYIDEGGLVISATEPDSSGHGVSDGALFYVSPPIEKGKPQKIIFFSGYKPEGVARIGKSDSLMVVFDMGDQTPMWMRILIPK